MATEPLTLSELRRLVDYHCAGEDGMGVRGAEEYPTDGFYENTHPIAAIQGLINQAVSSAFLHGLEEGLRIAAEQPDLVSRYKAIADEKSALLSDDE